MTIEEIQKRISALNDKVLNRGFERPDCQFHIHGDTFWVCLRGYHPSGDYHENLGKYVSGDTPEVALVKAEGTTIPSADEKIKQNFIKSLGKLIDKGREIGIDVDFINPLETSMRELSENILEHSPEPEPLDAETIAVREAMTEQHIANAGRGHLVKG